MSRVSRSLVIYGEVYVMSAVTQPRRGVQPLRNSIDYVAIQSNDSLQGNEKSLLE